MADVELSAASLNFADLVLRSESAETNDVLFSELAICTIPHRVTFLKVVKDTEGYWTPVSQMWSDELDKLYALTDADGELWPVELPGYDGEYLCYVYPFTR